MPETCFASRTSRVFRFRHHLWAAPGLCNPPGENRWDGKLYQNLKWGVHNQFKVQTCSNRKDPDVFHYVDPTENVIQLVFNTCPLESRPLPAQMSRTSLHLQPPDSIRHPHPCRKSSSAVAVFGNSRSDVLQRHRGGTCCSQILGCALILYPFSGAYPYERGFGDPE